MCSETNEVEDFYQSIDGVESEHSIRTKTIFIQHLKVATKQSSNNPNIAR